MKNPPQVRAIGILTTQEMKLSDELTLPPVTYTIQAIGEANGSLLFVTTKIRRLRDGEPEFVVVPECLKDQYRKIEPAIMVRAELSAEDRYYTGGK